MARFWLEALTACRDAIPMAVDVAGVIAVVQWAYDGNDHGIPVFVAL